MSMQHRDNTGELESAPFDQDIEACVIGAMLLEPERAVPLVRELLGPMDFYYRGHQVAFGAAIEIHDAGQRPDVYSMLAHLKAKGMLDTAGGSGKVMSWLNTVPTAAGIESHARQVLEFSRKRALLNAALRLRRDIGTGAVKADEAIAGLRTELEVISGRGVGADEIQALSGAVAGHLTKVARDLERAELDGVLVSGLSGGVTTGWPWLDNATGGWAPGDLVIWAARPNTGKTRLQITSLGMAAKEGTPVAFISLDMSGARLLRYMVPVLANINGANVLPDDIYRPHQWGQEQANLLDRVCKAADPNGCFWLLDNPRGRTYQALEAYIRALAKQGCKIIAIDQAQNIAGWGGGAVDRGVFYSTLQALKDAARSHGVTIVLLHQIQREGADRPQMKHLKDTGAFEEFSDFIVLLHDHQRNLKDNFGGFVVEKGRSRRPKEGDENIQHELDMQRPVWMNLCKTRAGAARQEWEQYDFARGVRA